MIKKIFAFIALLASASAFAPVNSPVARDASLNMALNMPEIKSKVVSACAGIVPAVMCASAAIATEGTNEMFGVDDRRLLGVLFIAHWGILSLYLREYGDELTATDDDFFGEIDYTRKDKMRDSFTNL